MSLETSGYQLLPSAFTADVLEKLRDSAFIPGSPGERCLLDLEPVKQAAAAIKKLLVLSEILPEQAVAIQAIAFDKSTDSNWKVPWHQDLMFPLSKAPETSGYATPSLKQGIHYARPPAEILGELLAARLHIDECDAENGPLRVSPGSHLHGMIPTDEIPQWVARQTPVTCSAKIGEILLMRPLLLHASSQATAPKHRRVLHFVYHSGRPVPEPWHRAI